MFKTRREIKSWLDRCGIIGYTINDNLTVDVNGYVHLYNLGLIEILVQFNIVNGNFDCSWNQLESLKGSPKIVNGCFDCSHNSLTSLKGSPEIVKRNFNCSGNQLTSLKYLPEISGKLVCDKDLHETKEYKVYEIKRNGLVRCLKQKKKLRIG